MLKVKQTDFFLGGNNVSLVVKIIQLITSCLTRRRPAPDRTPNRDPGWCSASLGLGQGSANTFFCPVKVIMFTRQLALNKASFEKV